MLFPHIKIFHIQISQHIRNDLIICQNDRCLKRNFQPLKKLVIRLYLKMHPVIYKIHPDAPVYLCLSLRIEKK